MGAGDLHHIPHVQVVAQPARFDFKGELVAGGKGDGALVDGEPYLHVVGGIELVVKGSSILHTGNLPTHVPVGGSFNGAESEFVASDKGGRAGVYGKTYPATRREVLVPGCGVALDAGDRAGHVPFHDAGGMKVNESPVTNGSVPSLMRNERPFSS